jgi:hypothetical protein
MGMPPLRRTVGKLTMWSSSATHLHARDHSSVIVRQQTMYVRIEAGSRHQPHDSHLSAHLREANWLCNTCMLVLVRTRFYGCNYFSNRIEMIYSIGKYNHLFYISCRWSSTTSMERSFQDGRCKRSFTLVLLGYHVFFSQSDGRFSSPCMGRGINQAKKKSYVICGGAMPCMPWPGASKELNGRSKRRVHARAYFIGFQTQSMPSNRSELILGFRHKGMWEMISYLTSYFFLFFSWICTGFTYVVFSLTRIGPPCYRYYMQLYDNGCTGFMHLVWLTVWSEIDMLNGNYFFRIKISVGDFILT